MRRKTLIRFYVLQVLNFLLAVSRAELNVPSMSKRKNVVVAREGDINIGYLANAHLYDVVHKRCGSDIYQDNCGYMQAMKFSVNEVNAMNDLLPNVSLGYVALDGCATSL
jgi:hypothetical protein